MNTFDKLVNILKYLETRGRNGASIKEMSQNLKIPASSLHRMLNNFHKYDFVRQDSMSKRYFIGLGFLKYADAALDSIHLDAICYPHMEELHALTGETIIIGVITGERVMCADIYGQRNLNIAVARGEVFPFHSTATGKVVLAFLPENVRRRVLDNSNFEKYTENTITSLKTLELQLDEIRQKGYSMNLAEYNVGINALAVPLFTYPDRITASLGVVGIAERLTEDKMQHYSTKFLEAARAISKELRGEFVPDRTSVSFR